MWLLSVQRWNANPNPNPDPNPNLHPVFTDKGHFIHKGLTDVHLRREYADMQKAKSEWRCMFERRGTTMTATNYDGHNNDGHKHDGAKS